MTSRVNLAEMMDDPCSYEELRACLCDLAHVNRLTRAYRPTLQWLEEVALLHKAPRPLHIVDVGCGGGDMLRCIESWAARTHVAVRLTGIDLNPYAIRAAREFSPEHSRIRWMVGDAESFPAADDPVDLVISSLFTHHLRDDQIVGFLSWMEGVAGRGWFINDLYRSRVSYLVFHALAFAAQWHRFVRHDGPVSIRRGFRLEDWLRYRKESGLMSHPIEFDLRWPARLCVSRIKQP